MYSWTFLVVLALVVAVRAQNGEQTPCQRHRDQMQNTRAGVRWNITCDSNGDYMPLQCTSDVTVRGKRWCSCYSKDGDIIQPPSTNIETCNCFVDRSNKGSNASSCEKPQCQNNGKYEAKQCCATTRKCQCVDENTGEKIGEATTDDITC